MYKLIKIHDIRNNLYLKYIMDRSNPFINRYHSTDNITDLNKILNINSNNVKRILCYSIFNNTACPYGKHCMYSHSIKTQKKDSLRERAYDIIEGNMKLDNIGLIDDTQLYETLLELTKTCVQCSKKKCPGGYNCKFGVFDEKLQLCRKDIENGNCANKCPYIHLTKRGLIPYNIQKHHKENENNPLKDNVWGNVPSSVYTNNKSIFIKKTQNVNDIEGILLSSQYFEEYDSNSSVNSETDADITNTINYLNSDHSYKSDSSSIFTKN